MSLSRLTLIETLRHLVKDGIVCRSEANGKYTCYSESADWLGIVPERIVAEGIEKQFLSGKNVPGHFGKVEYSITRKGIAHVEKVSQLRMKFANR